MIRVALVAFVIFTQTTTTSSTTTSSTTSTTSTSTTTTVTTIAPPTTHTLLKPRPTTTTVAPPKPTVENPGGLPLALSPATAIPVHHGGPSLWALWFFAVPGVGALIFATRRRRV